MGVQEPPCVPTTWYGVAQRDKEGLIFKDFPALTDSAKSYPHYGPPLKTCTSGGNIGKKKQSLPAHSQWKMWLFCPAVSTGWLQVPLVKPSVSSASSLREGDQWNLWLRQVSRKQNKTEWNADVLSSDKPRHMSQEGKWQLYYCGDY